MIGAAVDAGVGVLPVASVSSMFTRSARAEVGAAVRQRPHRRGPLGDLEMADAVQRRVQTMLDAFGDGRTGVAGLDRQGG
jgi:hypothetical protein